MCSSLVWGVFAQADCADSLHADDGKTDEELAQHYQNFDYTNYYHQIQNAAEDHAGHDGLAPHEGVQKVTISKSAEEQLKVLPIGVRKKLVSWIEGVESKGMMEMRNVGRFRDKIPNEATRSNQRAIHLTRGYLAFYVIDKSSPKKPITIVEVNMHEYE